MGVHPGVNSDTDEMDRGVVCQNTGTACHQLGLGAQSAQENHGGLDDGRRAARRGGGGGFNFVGF